MCYHMWYANKQIDIRFDNWAYAWIQKDRKKWYWVISFASRDGNHRFWVSWYKTAKKCIEAINDFIDFFWDTTKCEEFDFIY